MNEPSVRSCSVIVPQVTRGFPTQAPESSTPSLGRIRARVESSRLNRTTRTSNQGPPGKEQLGKMSLPVVTIADDRAAVAKPCVMQGAAATRGVLNLGASTAQNQEPCDREVSQG
jgi:hypothetical protein